MRNVFVKILPYLLAISVISCGPGLCIERSYCSHASGVLKSISVTQVTRPLVWGASQQLKATGTYSDGSTQDLTSVVTWSSSGGAGTISVGSVGLVATTSGQVDTSTITAALGSVQAAAPIATRPAGGFVSNAIGGASCGDGGPATNAIIGGVTGSAVDASGNIYLSELVKIRFIPQSTGTFYGQPMTAGNIYTIAGSGLNNSGSGDGGPALLAGFEEIYGVAVDSGGNVYLTDYGEGKVRMVPKANGTYFGVSMTAGYIYAIGFGNGGIKIDADDNIYVAGGFFGSPYVYMFPSSSGSYFGQVMTAQTQYIIAGTGATAYNGDGILATTATLNSPYDVAVDTSGNVYIADTLHYRIRMVPAAGGNFFGQVMTQGFIYTLAGTGTNGYSGDGALATGGNIRQAYGIGVDPGGNVYFTDVSINVRVVAATNTSLFGTPMNQGWMYRLLSNTCSATSLNVDPAGNLFIGGAASENLCMVPANSGTYYGQNMTSGTAYPIAGTTTPAIGTGGPAKNAQVGNAWGVAVDSSQNVFVADYANLIVLMVPAADGIYFGQTMTGGNVYTVAGNGVSGFTASGSLTGIAVDPSGNLYIASDCYVSMVVAKSGTYFGQSMTVGSAYILTGSGASGFSGDGGPATAGVVAFPSGVAVDSAGSVYIADHNNRRIRMIAANAGTFFGQPMAAASIYTIAGTGTSGYNGDGALATTKRISSATSTLGVAVDSNGNVFVGDSGNNRVRMIAAKTGNFFGQAMTSSFIYTIAGTGVAGYSGDGNAGTAAQTNIPAGLATDSSGNVYFADYSNSAVRVIAATAGTYVGQVMTVGDIYSIAGTGTQGYGGVYGSYATGSTMQIGTPTAVAIGPYGDVYISDSANHVVEHLYGE